MKTEIQIQYPSETGSIRAKTLCLHEQQPFTTFWLFAQGNKFTLWRKWVCTPKEKTTTKHKALSCHLWQHFYYCRLVSVVAMTMGMDRTERNMAPVCWVKERRKLSCLCPIKSVIFHSWDPHTIKSRITSIFGRGRCAIAHVVSRRLPTAVAQVRSQVIWELWWTIRNCGWFSPSASASPVNVIPRTAPHSLITLSPKQHCLDIDSVVK
jgi:hypothetical protein